MKKKVLIALFTVIIGISAVAIAWFNEPEEIVQTNNEIKNTEELRVESTEAPTAEPTVKTVESLGTTTNADRGASVGEDLAVDNTGNTEKEETPAVENTDNGTSNGGYIENEFDEAEQIYCTYEAIEPITLYAQEYVDVFYDPNLQEGNLAVTGCVERGETKTFTHKTTIEGVEYLSYTRKDGLVVIMEASKFAAEAPTTETPAPSPSDTAFETRPATDEDRQQAEAERQAEMDMLIDMGWTPEEAQKFVDGLTTQIVITPDDFIYGGNTTQDMIDALRELPDWLLDELDGVGLY